MVPFERQIELKITALRTMPMLPDYSCVREGGLVPSTEYTLHLAAPLKPKLGNRLANYIHTCIPCACTPCAAFYSMTYLSPMLNTACCIVACSAHLEIILASLQPVTEAVDTT